MSGVALPERPVDGEPTRAGVVRAGGRPRRPGPLRSVAALFVEPLEPAVPAAFGVGEAWTDLVRPTVAVVGVAPRCGTTTVARALAAELALRDPDGAAIVTAEAVAGGGLPLGTPAAGRLGRAVQRSLPSQTRAVGRLCLAVDSDAARLVETGRDLAPVVLDVAEPSQAAVAASLVDAVVLVAVAGCEPALGAVVVDSLERVGPRPVLALNRDRAGDPEPRWDGRCALRLPEARMGAQLALAGREARGELGRAVARLADRLGAAA